MPAQAVGQAPGAALRRGDARRPDAVGTAPEIDPGCTAQGLGLAQGLLMQGVPVSSAVKTLKAVLSAAHALFLAAGTKAGMACTVLV